MGDKSTIEWTDATWNPVTGCTKVSQGCKNCYAERLWPKVEAAERKREHFEWHKVTPRPFTTIRTHLERLEQPLRWAKPRRIFVNSMSDLFHEDVPDTFILQVFDIMRQCENGWTPLIGGDRGKLIASHTFQILTKRADRMRDFCTRLRFAQNNGSGLYLAESLPHNGFNPMSVLKHVWLGVSVEDQTTADERTSLLLQTPAAVRFISAEPLLGPVDLTLNGLWTGMNRKIVEKDPREPRLHWIIAGGESGPHARPSHPDWFLSLREQCKDARVPFFFKQWGEWAPIRYRDQHGTPLLKLEFSKREIAMGGPALGTTPYNMKRMGKREAGRELDGRTHDEYPA